MSVCAWGEGKCVTIFSRVVLLHMYGVTEGKTYGQHIKSTCMKRGRDEKCGKSFVGLTSTDT